ncbi:DUF3168 domain-containing protein [Agrobacterium rhizogenes]|uniref:DUF3168 domain-containing protein n=1 Tax=Rhizobium rhizogenes TaxID=359 RepID=UPI001572BAEA|nr:DUF3168 domain-containing protein [Rhizobium rhizogenes]NTG48971.1 DUF3168 domain-containing protein [Rhizobium rhizogenes]
MSSSDFELQKAVYSTLTQYAALSALVGDAVYDSVPDDATFPRVALGESDFQRGDIGCIAGGTAYLTLHAWSVEPGSTEVKQVAGAVEDALHQKPLTLSNHRVVTVDHRYTQTMRDADGLTSHAVINFAVILEKASS